MHIIKVGGNELDVPGFAEALAGYVKKLGKPTVVVHGGGRTVSSIQHRLGITASKVDGLRVTDAASLEVAVMVLCGLANKRLVAAFVRADLDAIGLSGVDGGLVGAVKKPHTQDLGFVGRVEHVRTQLLERLLSLGHTVILSPISLGFDGQLYNVNADEVAAATAIASKAETLSFVTNVAGVKRDGGVMGRVRTSEIEGLERDGIVEGGMIPKLRAAREAALAGVSKVRIVDLAGLSSGGGTVVAASQGPSITQPMNVSA